MKRKSWDRRAAYIKKYGIIGGPQVLRLLAIIARRGR